MERQRTYNIKMSWENVLCVEDLLLTLQLLNMFYQSNDLQYISNIEYVN